VLTQVARVWRQDVETMLAHSPLVEVTFDGIEPGTSARTSALAGSAQA
jgi:hypothetical protein